MSIVSTAQSYLGTPYVYGGNGYSGIDCSGLTQQSYAQNGISIPRTAQDQYNSSTKITQSQLKPNDLIFESSTGSTSNITHVMLYVGDGKAIESPHSGASVRYTDISTRSNIVGYGTYGASSSSSSSSKTSSSKTSSSSSSKTSSSSSSNTLSSSTKVDPVSGKTYSTVAPSWLSGSTKVNK